LKDFDGTRTIIVYFLEHKYYKKKARDMAGEVGEPEGRNYG